MSQALHIFRKDLRRGWPLLVLWAAILIASVAQSWPDPLFVERSDDVTQIPSLIGIAVLIGVGLLIHQEPLVGRNAFWSSRPIHPGALLAAKAAFVAAFLAGPALASQFVVLIRFGLSREQWIPGLIEAGVPWLAMVFLGFAIAALTPNTPVFVMACFAVWAAILVGKGTLLTIADVAEHGSENLLWFLLGIGAITILTSAGVVANQYLTRRIDLSIGIAAVGVLAGFTMPRDLGDAAQRVIEGVAPTPTMRIDLRPGGQRELFPASRPVPLSRGAVGIWATARPHDAPPGHDVELIGLRGQIDWREGPQTPFSPVRSWFAREGVQEGAGGLAWFGGRGVGRVAHILHVHGPGRFEDYLSRTGTLHAEAPARLWRIEAAAGVAIEAGARAQGSSWRAVLQRVQVDDGRLRIRYRLSRVDSMLWPSRAPKLLLRNISRNQMIAPGMGIPLTHNDFGALAAGPRVQIEDAEIEFPLELRRRSGEVSAVGEDWLAGAELTFLEYVPAGRLKAVVEVQELALEEQLRPRPQAVTELWYRP